MDKDTLLREITMLALLNQLSNQLNLLTYDNEDARFRNLSVQVYTLKQDLEDKMREDYIDAPVPIKDAPTITNPTKDDDGNDPTSNVANGSNPSSNVANGSNPSSNVTNGNDPITNMANGIDPTMPITVALDGKNIHQVTGDLDINDVLQGFISSK